MELPFQEMLDRPRRTFTLLPFVITELLEVSE
jgi:hypothetical protein